MQWTASELWTGILAIASAVVLLANAAEKVGKAISAAKKPNREQDERIGRLENRLLGVEDKLKKDKERLDSIDEGERVSQMALLALLDHSLDGNNIKQMELAKDALQKHLLNK